MSVSTIGPIGPPAHVPPTKLLRAELQAAQKQLAVSSERSGVASEAVAQQRSYVAHLQYLLGWATVRDAHAGAGNVQRQPSGQERPGHAGGGGGGTRRVS